ncbi:MAG: hypothetical protein MI725_01075 [Pirellulales bacterium]|nr:hypothetical protein [Pirellulales bacterium]
MPLIDDVKAVCDRLATRGWRQLLLKVTNSEFDIQQSSRAKLKAALTKPLASIDRNVVGFEDFHPTANQAITAGKPSHSLFYHALASPNVHSTTNGQPSPVKKDYPTLNELDIVENFIYSLAADRTDLDDTIIAVFAYQYRVASRTSHLRFADLAFSRTGIARVGTTKFNYDESRRSFWVTRTTGGDAICVLPARYGVFLARRAKPGASGSVQGGHSGAADENFVFPVHKLFTGKECLEGRDLRIDYLEYHRNEKLHKTHAIPVSSGGLPLPTGFDTSKLPYIRDSKNRGKLTTLKDVGSSVLIVPTPGASLLRTVAQKNSVTGTKQVVHFVVPQSPRITTSTLMIPASGRDRLAPEYVNIRHQINPRGSVNQTPKDLNELSESAFLKAMKEGGHAAAHFTDDSCDGCVEAVVTGLQTAMENLPAFSLVTAPDFFPLADQFEVSTDPSIRRVQPLSEGRLPANPTLPLPSNPSVNAFDQREKTVTAVVGATASGPMAPVIGQTNRMVSFLPDSASNVFAPGWDTSRSRDAMGTFLTSSGLGSPFPEDAKLCAAIASFWPAVAPDNGRTFGNDRSPQIDIGLGNQLPMLDEEIGFHPKHERVKSNEVPPYTGWDGEYGPFFQKVGNKLHVNYVAIERSDYVAHALAGRIRVSLTAEVQSEDLIARNQALEACQQVLDSTSQVVCLVVFRKIDDWQSLSSGVPQLRGAGFLLEFAELKGNRKSTSEKSRVQKEVAKRHVCQYGENGVAYKNGGAAFKFLPH